MCDHLLSYVHLLILNSIVVFVFQVQINYTYHFTTLEKYWIGKGALMYVNCLDSVKA